MDEDAAAVLGVGPNPSVAEIEEAYERELWQLESNDDVPWKTHVELTQRLQRARQTLLRQCGLPPPLAPSDRRPLLEDECERCGCTPALPVTFRQQIGKVFTSRTDTSEGRLCRDCGLALGREVQNRTIATGWWGVRSFFRNVRVVGTNSRTLLATRHLQRPERRPDAPLTPAKAPRTARPPVFLRPALLIPFVIALAIGARIETLHHRPPTWAIGHCVKLSGNSGDGHELLFPVRCSKPHIAVIVGKVTRSTHCPPDTDTTVRVGTDLYCIKATNTA
ncbi:MAG TPA: hypothetical protein VK461_02060 [Acidimicrobiales bacterium]|nr:hypothetical protein [Acidimicrobiales bacterium]